MKVLVVTSLQRVVHCIALLLKVRWPDLVIIECKELKRCVELLYGECPDIVFVHHDPATLPCLQFVRTIRNFSDVPVVVVSDKHDIIDKVAAFEMGADDWILPSQEPMELVSRVHALLRRSQSSTGQDGARVSSGSLTLDCVTREVSVSGRQIKLTPIETKILCHLAKREGVVVSNADLSHAVWGPYHEADPEILKKYICRLRSKIEDDPATPRMIQTEKGAGHVFVAPLHPAK